jgi:hypothetical protein
MNLTGQQLEQLEVMAGLFFSVKEILIALEIPLHRQSDFEEILKWENSHPASLAYHKGRLTSEAELRQSIKQAALNGSNPAQTTMMEFFNSSKL